MPRTIDPNFGYKIIKLAHDNQDIGIGFREVQRSTGFANDTIVKWFKLLYSWNMIEHDRKGKIRLTIDTWKKYDSGEFVIPNSERYSRDIVHRSKRRNIDNEKERNEKILLLISSIAAFGASYFKPVQPSKSRPGDILVYSISRKKDVYYTFYKIRGVGISDLVKHASIKKKTDLLDPEIQINPGHGMLFGYLNVTEAEARDSIKILKNHEPPILGLIDSDSNPNTEPRYNIADPLLKKYIERYMTLLSSIRRRFRYEWIYIKWPKEHDIIKWYHTLYGLHTGSVEFTSVYEEKKRMINNSKSFREAKKDFSHYVNYVDRGVRKVYNELENDPKYNETFERYKIIMKPFRDMAFPSFLLDRIKHL